MNMEKANNENIQLANIQQRLANLTPEQRELLVKRMNQQKQEKPKNVLVIKEGDNTKRRPLFCTHPPLGVTGYYLNIANYLHEDQPVYGIQCPVPSGAEEAHSDMTEMAKAYLEQIKAIQPEPPYQIVGHSSGGFIAYEISRLLDEDEMPKLFIIDQHAPIGEEEALAEAYSSDDLDDNIQTIYVTCWLVSMAHGTQLTFSIEQLASCESRNEKYELVGQFLKEAGFIPQSSDLSMVSKVLHMIANHFNADTNYINSFNEALPDHKYNGNLTLFRSTEDTTWLGLDFVTEADSSPASGWEPFCSKPINVIDIPNSDHINLLLEPVVRALATKLDSYLFKAE